MNFDHVESKSRAEESAKEAGYCKSPNNIYAVPGWEWYPSRAGLPQMAQGVVFIDGGESNPARIQDTWPIAFYNHVYGKHTVLAMHSRYANWLDFMEACSNQRIISLPGQPAYMYGE